MDGLNKGVEAKMDGSKKGMEDKVDGLKKGMKGKMGGLKKGVEAKMDGVEATMNGVEANMDGIEEKIKGNEEYLKIDLTMLLQEMVTNGERVVKKTHGESKRNANNYFIYSNIGLNTHRVPNIDMRKFDAKDLVTWILPMEQYFNLHNVENTQKVCIATLYLEPNLFVWC